MKAIPVTDFVCLDGLTRGYIIPGLVPEVGRIALYGVPKRGKSFLALQLALSVCQGTPFLGFEVVKPGPVLYLQFDTPPEMWQERLKKLAGAGVALPSNLYTPDPHSLPRHINLLNDTHAQGIQGMVTATLPALVIVDVLRSVHRLSENESEHMQQIVARLTSLFTGRALLLVHHTSKPSNDPRALEASPSSAGRGSSYLGGEMDANWLLRGKGEGCAALAVEARFAAPFHEISLRQNEIGLWVRGKAGRPAVSRTAYQEAILLDPELPNLSIRQASERTGIARSTIHEARQEAVRNTGLLYKSNGLPDTTI